MKVIQSGVKKKKLAGCQIFYFLPSAADARMAAANVRLDDFRYGLCTMLRRKRETSA